MESRGRDWGHLIFAQSEAKLVCSALNIQIYCDPLKERKIIECTPNPLGLRVPHTEILRHLGECHDGRNVAWRMLFGYVRAPAVQSCTPQRLSSEHRFQGKGLPVWVPGSLGMFGDLLSFKNFTLSSNSSPEHWMAGAVLRAELRALLSNLLF